MSGFTKLVPEIVVSSIWNESPEVRCVWIAMLATKDQFGNVRGNRESLRRVANVSAEAVQDALAVLSSPDADSNSKENEGRRIVDIPGGWHIVNHAAYREKTWREVEAQRKRKEREKSASVRTCPDLSGLVPDCSASASVSVSVSDISKGDARGEEREGGKSKDKPKRKAAARFVPPTPEEVTDYSAEIGWPMDGAAWCDVYAAKGWLAGKTAMKDWRAAVRNWKRSAWTSCSLKTEARKSRADDFAAEMDRGGSE